MAHSFAESAINGFDDEVVVVAHKTVGVTKPIKEIAAPGKDIKEDGAIFIIAEDVFLLISARGNVIKGSGKFYA